MYKPHDFYDSSTMRKVLAKYDAKLTAKDFSLVRPNQMSKTHSVLPLNIQFSTPLKPANV